MNIIIPPQTPRDEAIKIVRDNIHNLGFKTTLEDVTKPWGAYFVIDENDINKFISEFFSDVKVEKNGKLTPKILLVDPEELLSWQYHHRRAELWKVISGPIEIVQSNTDKLSSPIRKHAGELVQHDKQIRHRLIGAGVWGVVAEIWQHTDPTNPSNEEDIVRLDDAYGR
jgi:mannose-6-phosphate isomerase-like protein (cupin superfamily)